MWILYFICSDLDFVGSFQFRARIHPLKQFVVPRMKGGNIIVEVNEEDYQGSVIELKYSVAGRLSL